MPVNRPKLFTTSQSWKSCGDSARSVAESVPCYCSRTHSAAVITTGISLSRPPRTNLYMGYSIIDTGPIKTSALNASISYWLSPKWYGTFANSYDFGVL